MKRKILGLLAAGLLADAHTAGAVTLFTADLTNDQENPPAIPTVVNGALRPASFGTASFVLNDPMTALTFTATVYNIDFTGTQSIDINDNLIAAHIHAASTVTSATNAPVVWGFFGAPLNDNNPNDIVLTPFATGVGGTITGKWDAPEGNNTNLGAQLTNLLTGHAYMNFHTVQFAGGEIRGAIQRVPEPGTLALLGLGLAGLGLSRRRKAA